MGFFIHFLCLVGLLSRTLVNCTITDDEEPKKTFPIRRAIDGTRGRKYYDPEEDNPYDNYGSSSGRYDSYEDETDLSDIRNNVPGEPGVDYPAYTRLPQTEFVCEDHFRGYYADEGAGCQVFHVCDSSFLVSSFVCPIGSIFSQKLLTCDWWNKVDCSSTRNYHVINVESHVSEVDDDEILRKAFEMARVQSAGERIPVETVASQQQEQARHEDRKHQTVFNYGSSITERINALPIGQESYSDYPDYQSHFTSRHKATFGKQNRQRHRDEDYYSRAEESKSHQRDDSNPAIKVHTIGEDRKNDRSGSFGNEYQPSYAPTVPTVVTTARKFYSPTIPTTPRPSTTRNAHGRYDLEFESSDHLYTARGRSEETVKAATPSPDSSKVKVESVTASLPSFINSAAERDHDKMEQSESTHKIHSPIQQIRRNFTESFNDTMIIPPSDREEAVRGDLHRSTERITEKLSILTIDNENRDPTVFSYDHDERTNPDGGKIVKDGVETFKVGGTTNLRRLEDSNDDDDKPSEFLQPPLENQSIFRITVLDDHSTWNNEQLSSSQATLKTDQNSTEKSEPFQAPATVITPPLLDAKNDLLDSRIIRIVFDNNVTETNSSEKLTDPSISVDKIVSTDLTAERFSDMSATDGRINLAGVDVELEESMNKGTSDSTKSADFISPTTPADSNFVIEERKSSKLEDSPSTEILPPIVSIPTSIDPEKSIYSEDIFAAPLSNASKIDDTIELGSSPFQVTLTIDKNEEIDPSGDEIRKLIAEQDIGDSIGAGDFKSFEIVRSNQPHTPALIADDRNADTSHDQSSNLQSNKLQSMNYLRSIVDFIDGPNSPRPFSFGQPNNVDIKTSSDENVESISNTSSTFVSQAPKNVNLSEATRAPIPTTESIVSSYKDPSVEKSFETLEVSSSGFARDANNNRPSFQRSSANFDDTKGKTNEEKSIFQLPGTQRFLDFETGLPLKASEESEIRIDHEDSNRKSNETNEDLGKVHGETVVQTEFIPSLGFSLNTEEEREKYMEAVVKGLLHDVTASEKTNNETDTSLES